MKLHLISGSPNSWRVQLCLEFKNLPYESIRIDPSGWDRDKTGFYDLNPRGKVPVLEDGGYVIYESIAIMNYLETKYPQKKLFGSTPEETSLIWQKIAELIHYSVEPMYLLSRSLMRGKALDDIFESNKTSKIICSELTQIENWLESSSYLSENKMTAVDLYFYPVIAFLERISNLKNDEKLLLDFLPLDEKFPTIKNWMKRIEIMPGFKSAYPLHWR